MNRKLCFYCRKCKVQGGTIGWGPGQWWRPVNEIVKDECNGMFQPICQSCWPAVKAGVILLRAPSLPPNKLVDKSWWGDPNTFDFEKLRQTTFDYLRDKHDY